MWAPVVALGLLEATLRMAGGGRDLHYFRRVGDRMVMNRDFLWQFVPSHLGGDADLLSFPVRKGAGVQRILVLGSSAARGTPDPTFSFSRVLEVMLAHAYPSNRFEIINTGLSAMNSHVVRLIAEECASYEVDGVIVYMGNNEVVGPYGPGTVFGAGAGPPWLVRGAIRARGTRTGQALLALQRRWRGDDAIRAWNGMAEFAGRTVAQDDVRLKRVYAAFRDNLEAIVQAGRDGGAKVILCTVPVNLADCAPFASLLRHGPGEPSRSAWQAAYGEVPVVDSAATGEALERLLATGPEYAELRYRLGRLEARRGDAAAARAHLVAARDLDGLRFRADSRINAIICEVAAEQGVTLVDAEAGLERVAGGPPGRVFFHEHVHLNERGNYELAKLVLPSVAPGAGGEVGPSPLSQEACEEALLLTPWDRVRMRAVVLGMMKRPPFTTQYGHAQQLHELQDEMQRWARKISPTEQATAAQRAVQLAAGRPDDDVSRRHAVALLRACGRWAEAAEQLDLLLARYPEHPDLLVELGWCRLGESRVDEAERLFARAVRGAADPLEMEVRVAAVLMDTGAHAQRARWLYAALERDPGAPLVHALLGDALMEEGKAVEATEHFRRAVAGAGYDAENHAKLGAALLMLGDARGAAATLEDATALDPWSAVAHYNLARACIVLGRAERAVAVAERACALGPAGDARFIAVRDAAYRLMDARGDGSGPTRGQ